MRRHIPWGASRRQTTSPPLRIGLWAVVMLLAAGASPGVAVEIRGQADLGHVAGQDARTAGYSGLGKGVGEGLGVLARATLRFDGDLFATFPATLVVEAGRGRKTLAGIQEASVGWHPVPRGSWRTRIRAGAFFPVPSLEVGYDSVGWRPTRTLSSSAVNTWFSEELRSTGLEAEFLRRGVMSGSPHTFGVTASVFMGNDPNGTLLSWRGWNLGSRVVNLAEPITLPDLPVYRADGAIPLQTRRARVFREIDGRAGLNAGLRYGHRGWLDVSLLRYDNRADPLRIVQGQYAWNTRFDHASLRLRVGGNWEILAQGLQGSTRMGPNAVNLDFAAGYLLASHPLGRGHATVRHDRFQTRDRDGLPGDPNDESGNAWALAYAVPLQDGVEILTEALWIDSTRPARDLVGEAPRQVERRLSMLLRWRY